MYNSVSNILYFNLKSWSNKLYYFKSGIINLLEINILVVVNILTYYKMKINYMYTLDVMIFHIITNKKKKKLINLS